MNGVRVLQELRHDGMTALVVGRELSCPLAHDLALLLRTHLHLAYGLFYLVGGDESPAVRDSHERGLVEEVLQVRAGEARRAAGDGIEVHVVAQGLAPGVYAKYGLPAPYIWQTDIYPAVEAARAGQCVVQDIVAVRGRHDDDALVVGKAVHLDEQLVQSLLSLIVAAAEAGAALTSDGVYLVYEDDGRRHLLGLVEQVTHTRSADADIELDEVRAGYRQKLHASLSRDGLGYKRFAGTRRAYEQHALGYARAHIRIGAGILQEADDLLQLGLLFVAAGHVREGDLLLLLAA